MNNRSFLAHDEVANNTTTATAVTSNDEPSQRRVQSVNRQHLNETIRRLAKPKTNPMTQSIQIGATSSSNGMPSSQSSHQLRVPTPPVTTNNHSTATGTTSSHARRVSAI
jgi:hypothetical protein